MQKIKAFNAIKSGIKGFFAYIKAYSDTTKKKEAAGNRQLFVLSAL